MLKLDSKLYFTNSDISQKKLTLYQFSKIIILPFLNLYPINPQKKH